MPKPLDDLWFIHTLFVGLVTSYPEAILWHNVFPEPSSLLALGAGLLALTGVVRKRR
jgi:hypothetical protein